MGWAGPDPAGPVTRWSGSKPSPLAPQFLHEKLIVHVLKVQLDNCLIRILREEVTITSKMFCVNLPKELLLPPPQALIILYKHVDQNFIIAKNRDEDIYQHS